MRHASVVLALVAVGALVAPGAAEAQLQWSAPQPVLTPTGTNVSDVRLAMGAGGHTVVAWEADDATVPKIQGSLREPGQFVPLPKTLTPATASGGGREPEVAIDATGNATVAYDWSNGTSSYVAAARRQGGGAFLNQQVLSQANQANALSRPAVVIEASGKPRVVWNGQNAGQLQYLSIWTNLGYPADGWEQPQQLSFASGAAYDQPDEQQVAVAPDGAVLIVFRWQQNNVDQIWAAYKPTGTTTFNTPVAVPGSDTGFRPQVAYAGNGEFALAWHMPGTVIRTAQMAANGSLSTGTNYASTMQTSDGPQPQGNEIELRSNAAGLVAAIFVDGALQPRVALKPPGQPWGTPAYIQNNGQPGPASGTASLWPDVGINDAGDVVAVWQSTDYDGNPTIRTAHRKATGDWPRVPGDTGQQLSPAGLDASRPEVGLDASGNAVAVWEVLADGNYRAQAAIGGPPGPVQTPPAPPPPTPAPPPPPPAPPGVPVVSDVKFEAPIRRGAPMVVTAVTSGTVRRLLWTVDGQTIAGETLNGQLQRTVRFRTSDTKFNISVRAVGPGGTGPAFARAYAQAAPRAAAAASKRAHAAQAGDPIGQALDELKAYDIKTMQQRVEREGTAVAVGQANALLGKAGVDCTIPTTVKSGAQVLTGCLKAIPGLDDLPTSERGVLKPLADELGISTTDTDRLKAAVALSDGFTTKQPLQLPGGFPLEPLAGANIITMPQAKAIASANAAFRVGGDLIKKTGFVLPMDPKTAITDLGTLPKLPRLPKIGGFELAPSVDVTFKDGYANIKATLKLPSIIKTGGVDAQASVSLRATPNDYLVDDVVIGPINAAIGGIGVSGLKLSYTRATDTWQGEAKACLPGGACLDMTPPQGLVRFVGGRFDYAGATLQFPLPGITLFPGLTMERIGFGIGTDPTRILGSTRLALGSIVAFDGRMVTAFPSASTPFYLRRDEVGDGFAANLYGVPHTRPTVGMSAEPIVKLPGIGETKLGNGYFLYEFPGYSAFGGGIDLSFIDIITLRGGISGEIEATQGVFNLHGDIEGCVDLVVEACASAVANVSRGKGNSGGAGGCVGVAGVHIGGGVQWNRLSKPFIWPFDGCKWSRFKIDVRAQTAQAGGGTTTLKAGEAIQLDGKGGAPLVKVTGPDGTVVESKPGSGLTVGAGGKVRILRYEGQAGTFTIAGVQAPASGGWKVTTADGSVPVAKASRATDPPDAKVTAKVTGTGDTRTLTYDVERRPDQVITFQEISRGGAAKTIGRITGGGKGTLRFKPAPGRGTRRIQAQFELNGLPAEHPTIARFAPPSPVLAAPRGLRVTRTKRGLAVTWRPVKDATGYELVTTVRGGAQKLVRTRAKRTSVRLAETAAGTVSVRATASLREGRLVKRTFKARAKDTGGLRKLAKCKGKRKLVCKKA